MPLSSQNILFIYKTHVRIDDINFGNHLCHSKYINIIHDARAVFLKKHNLSELNCFGSRLIMLSLTINYINQCFFNDLLEITLAIDKLERSKLSINYSMFNHTSKKLAADANTLIGFQDVGKEKLNRIPIEFSKLIDFILHHKSV